MTSRALNEWAVMNLSMEDRGDKPTEEPVKRGNKMGLGATRFLNGNLSYFGVSSSSAKQSVITQKYRQAAINDFDVLPSQTSTHCKLIGLRVTKVISCLC